MEIYQITRLWIQLNQKTAIHFELRVPLGKALEDYTIGPAAAGVKSGQQGSLAPGYWADLIVLEKDPFSCSEDELRELRPSATMIDGEWVWRDF